MTIVDQPRPGPQRPVPSTLPRAPSSMRRTTTIDITRPDGVAGRVVAVLAGQDLATDAGGCPSVVARWRAEAPVDPLTGEILALDGSDGPGDDGLAVLVGASLRSGFGRRLASALPGEARDRSLRYSLLEDLAGAFLVSGYAPLRAGLLGTLLGGDVDAARDRAALQADICVGWAGGGPVHRALAEHGHTAVPTGPPAPPIERDDPAGWHPLPPLGHETVRRRRLLDVRSDLGAGGLVVHSHFRDSHAGEEHEMVMHEYTVDAVVRDGLVGSIEADARVLPWAACPGAVPSAGRVAGVAVDDLAHVARTELVGPSTCTHLSSTTRSLADVAALVPPA